MRAIQYLQKVGAFPKYKSEDCLMAVITMTKSLFFPETITYPGSVKWVKGARDESEATNMSNAVIFSTSGDVRALYPHIYDKSVDFLRGLIETLIEISAYLCAQGDGYTLDLSDDNKVVEFYNDLLQLRGSNRFKSKSLITHLYCSGALSRSGEEVLGQVCGSREEFKGSLYGLYKSFSDFVKENSSLSVESFVLVNEDKNPLEGWPQVRVFLRDPRRGERDSCYLCWAPWNTARCDEGDTELSSLCERFNDRSAEGWFSDKG